MTTKTKSAESDVLSLFPPAPDVEAGTRREAVYLLLAEIEPDPDQPRKNADAELADSIRQEGVLQPITVRPHPDPSKVAQGIKYMIKFGERRYWGSIDAGKTTIPAFIDESDDEEARRLIRQYVENTHKSLDPRAEALLFKRVRDLTGASMVQLAQLFGKPKTTVSDRLAMADAPEAFQPLFDAGTLSAAAAPLFKKFEKVPARIMETVAAVARQDWQWTQAIKAGKSVPLDVVEATLDRIILKEELRQVPESLALLYQGETCKIGGIVYATDLKEFDRAYKANAKAQEEKNRAERERQAEIESPASGSESSEPLWDDEGEEDAPATKATKAPKVEKRGPTPAEKKAADKARREREAAALEEKKWTSSKAAIEAAIASALKRAPTDAKSKLVAYVEDEIIGLVIDRKAVEKLIPRGSTVSDLVRYWVMADLINTVRNACETGSWNVEGTRDRLMKEVARLGLKVDLRKVLDAAVKDEPKTDPSKGAKGKGAATAKTKSAAKQSAKGGKRK